MSESPRQHHPRDPASDRTHAAADDSEPDGAGPESPVKPANIRDLYLRPTRFFQKGLALGEKRYLYPALVGMGMARASGRIDTYIMRAELDNARQGWSTLEPLVMDSWVTYWGFILAAGIVGSVFIWYLWGWWYHIRIRWSGDPDRDKRRARLTLVWSSLVHVLPTLVYLVGATIVFSDYGDAWSSEELLSVAFLVFPFWSVVTSYKGVRAQFDVGRWKARTWFLILPLLVYFVAFGAVGALYWFFDPGV